MSHFLQFAEERGLVFSNSPIMHRWARTSTIDHPHKKNGAYIFYGDFGVVQNWATMQEAETWFSDLAQTPFEKELQEAKLKSAQKQYAQQRADGQRKAAAKAKWILSQCELDCHAYLDSKGFPEMRGNVWRKPDCDPLLVVPMYCGDTLCGCQLVDITGQKKFLTGQRTNDSYFKIGQSGRDILCEGYATAISIHAILAAARMPATIYAAFSVGNATRLAKTHPSAFWIADNDVSGVGQKAAAESGLKYWMPPESGTDANDWHKSVGLFRATMELKKVLLAR